MGRGVPEPGDREVRPLGPEVGPPRGAAFNDRDGGALNFNLETDLVRGVRWHASVDEPLDPGEIQFRELRSGGHRATLPTAHAVGGYGAYRSAIRPAGEPVVDGLFRHA